MDKEKLLITLKNSFLGSLLEDIEITDISYNGDSIYYLHNYLGRQKSQITVTEAEVKDFIRQIANLSEKQFSFQNPKLDVSFGKYRINAVHPSIGRKNNERSIHIFVSTAKQGSTNRTYWHQGKKYGKHYFSTTYWCGSDYGFINFRNYLSDGGND